MFFIRITAAGQTGILETQTHIIKKVLLQTCKHHTLFDARAFKHQGVVCLPGLRSQR